jgi:hypothetical protein
VDDVEAFGVGGEAQAVVEADEGAAAGAVVDGDDGGGELQGIGGSQGVDAQQAFGLLAHEEERVDLGPLAGEGVEAAFSGGHVGAVEDAFTMDAPERRHELGARRRLANIAK